MVLSAGGIGMVVDGSVAGVSRRAGAGGKQARIVTPARIQNREDSHHDKSNQARAAALCLSQRAFISSGEASSIFRPWALISASMAWKRRTNLPVAAARAVSLSTRNLRERFTTLKRRSPNSSSMAVFCPLRLNDL